MARTRRRAQAPPPQRLILDSGAVIALARNDGRARAALAAAWEAGVEIAVPAVVLAETVRGSANDAPVNRVLKAVGKVIPVDDQTGRAAGALLGASRSDSTGDALVVASAIRSGGGVILTGDAGDLTALAGGHPGVLIASL
jgi:predicted nucleic acid-binding protein